MALRGERGGEPNASRLRLIALVVVGVVATTVPSSAQAPIYLPNQTGAFVWTGNALNDLVSHGVQNYRIYLDQQVQPRTWTVYPVQLLAPAGAFGSEFVAHGVWRGQVFTSNPLCIQSPQLLNGTVNGADWVSNFHEYVDGSEFGIYCAYYKSKYANFKAVPLGVVEKKVVNLSDFHTDHR